MTPTILLQDGKPYMALGSPGGPTIINSVLEVIVNVLDFGMNLQEAVNRPRSTISGCRMNCEWKPGISPDTSRCSEGAATSVKRVDAQGEVRRHSLDGRLAGRRRSAQRSDGEGH